jgi:AraC-like DNA-binding protein
LIRFDALSGYAELVTQLGGDPAALAKKVGIEVDVGKAVEFIPYRKMVELLHYTALALERPDFGLALAQEQGGTAILGPLEVAMKNCPTLGEALAYYMTHSDLISPAVSMALEWDATTGRPYFRHEMFVRYPPHSQQVSEHAMAALHHGLVGMSNGKVRSREVWFAHGALSNPAFYRRYFGTRVEMNMPYTALFLDEADLDIALPDTARNLFDLADAYIDKECAEIRTFASKVRSIVIKLLAQGPVTKAIVARKLNMHPKTLQRRLQEEGTTFELLRGQVRRDTALRYLTETAIPITRVAAMLGYSETAVLSRSCRQWFGYAPSTLRRRGAERLDGDPMMEWLTEPTVVGQDTTGALVGAEANSTCDAGTLTMVEALSYIRQLESENRRLRAVVGEVMADSSDPDSHANSLPN